MKKMTEEWLKSAKDDLDVIERIINDAHLSHVVAFHAQQAIEKGFKAVLEEYEINVPRIHHLVTLFGKIEGYIDMKNRLKTLSNPGWSTFRSGTN